MSDREALPNFNLYRELLDAHLTDANETAADMREHLRDQITDVFTRFASVQTEVIQAAYAQGVRDGFVQGVARAGGASSS